MSMRQLHDLSRVYLEQIATEAFVDPEQGEAPSGRSPLQNVSDHPKASVRKKAVGAFKKQMGKEYGGTWKSRTKDPVAEAAKPDYLDFDKDGNKKEPMKKALKDKEKVTEAVRGQDTEMRKAASQERQAERKERGGAAPKIPGREGPSAGKSYADYQQVSMRAHDKATKGKYIPGMVKNEALDPVGREDADIDNDGDTDKSDKYLHKRRKAVGKAIATRKESFSNWRQDLAEVIDEPESDTEEHKQIKEKKNINNKIVINPDFKEAVEELGGVLLETVELEEGYKPIGREKESAMYRRAGNLARTSLSSRGKKKEEAQTKSAKIVSAITRQKEKERFDKIGQSPAHNEEFKLDEKTLTPAETKKKEEIVMSMKKKGDFSKYGKRAKEVMYATATKQAKKLAEADMPQATQPSEKRNQTQQKQRLLQILQQKERAVRSGLTDISASYEPNGEIIDEKQSALDIVKASAGPGLMTGKTKKPKATAAQKAAAQKASADYIKKTSAHLQHSPRD